MAAKKAASSTKKSKSTKVRKDNSTSVVSTITTSKKSTSGAINSITSVYKKYRRMPIIAQLIAEFIGTFILVVSFFAVQAQPLYLAFIMISIVMLFGRISGAYVNPAMVIGGWVTKKIKAMRAFLYILAEILAAVAAWFVMTGFINKAYGESEFASQVLFHADTVTAGNEWLVFFSELLAAFILGLAVSAAIRARKNSVKSALTYGFGILSAALFAGWATSMILSAQYAGLAFINPAIAIAAQGLSWSLWPISMFVLAPVAGAILGFLVSEAIRTDEDECVCS
jgi:glycerol uptake facilitator-like aquaporin